MFEPVEPVQHCSHSHLVVYANWIVHITTLCSHTVEANVIANVVNTVLSQNYKWVTGSLSPKVLSIARWCLVLQKTRFVIQVQSLQTV